MGRDDENAIPLEDWTQTADLRRNLSRILGEDFLVLTTSAALHRFFRDMDVPALSTDELAAGGHSPGAAVLCVTDLESLPKRGFFEESLGRSSLLIIPFTAFDASPPAVMYGLGMLSHMNLDQHVAGAQRWLETFALGPATLHADGAGTELNIRLGDDIRILAAKTEIALDPGEWASIAQYLEVTLVPLVDKHNRGFSIDGVLMAEACSVAHHRYFHSTAGPLSKRAWETIESVRQSGGFPLTVTIEDSVIRSVATATGAELLHQLLGAVDPEEGPAVHEVAVSSASLPRDLVDWTYNSQFNEAAGGMHVAIGSGLRGAHIDFVATRAEARQSGAS